MDIIKFLAWAFAITIVAGVAVGFVLTVWQHIEDARLTAALTKYLEAHDDDLDE